VRAERERKGRAESSKGHACPVMSRVGAAPSAVLYSAGYAFTYAEEGVFSWSCQLRPRFQRGKQCSSVGRASETVSKLVTACESCYGGWGCPRVARTLYVRVAKRQATRTSCKQRSLCQRFITSCAPAYAGAPGGYCLRATQCSTISTTSGILRQSHLARHFWTGETPVPPMEIVPRDAGLPPSLHRTRARAYAAGACR
jgi:hypothetical protein